MPKMSSNFCLFSYICDISPHQVINIKRQCIVILPILTICIMRMYFDTIKFVHYFMMILTKFNLHFNMSLSVPRTPLSQLCFYIPPAQHIVRLCRVRAKESVVEGRGGWILLCSFRGTCIQPAPLS